MEVFIGRQPIFDKQNEVVAFELLYRNSSTNNAFAAINPDEATIDVLINSFFSFGIEELSHGKPCFINFTENLLLDKLIEQLPKNKVVIEILEDIPLTETVIQRMKELKQKGYKIALDDFIFQKDISDRLYFEAFKYVDLIKVDYMLSTTHEREKIEIFVRRFFPDIKLLAEKVETYEEEREAIDHGYELFQGYYFKRPQIVSAHEIPSNFIQYYQVMALLRATNPNIDEVAEHIEHDLSLSFKLLKLINSSPKRTKRKKVRSIKQAILLLGLEDLQRWVYILAYRDAKNNNSDSVYEEVMKSSLYRAKVCELLAKLNEKENYSEHFLVGLFSLIDVLLKKPMNDVLQQLPLTDEVLETISDCETKMTPYLQIAIALERKDWTLVEQLSLELEVDMEQLLLIVNEATKWSSKIDIE